VFEPPPLLSLGIGHRTVADGRSSHDFVPCPLLFDFTLAKIELFDNTEIANCLAMFCSRPPMWNLRQNA